MGNKQIYIVVYEYEDDDGCKGVNFLGAYLQRGMAYEKLLDMEKTIIHNNTFDGELWYEGQHHTTSGVWFSTDKSGAYEGVYIKEMTIIE